MYRKVKIGVIGVAVMLGLSGGLAYAGDPCEGARDLLRRVGEWHDDCEAEGDCEELEILGNDLTCFIDECENVPGGVCTAEAE